MTEKKTSETKGTGLYFNILKPVKIKPFDMVKDKKGNEKMVLRAQIKPKPGEELKEGILKDDEIQSLVKRGILIKKGGK